MGPNDLRFKEMMEYQQDAPAEISEGILLAYKHMAKADKEELSIPLLFNEVSLVESTPPQLITDTIRRRFEKRTTNRVYRKSFLRVFVFCAALLMVFIIFQDKAQVDQQPFPVRLTKQDRSTDSSGHSAVTTADSIASVPSNKSPIAGEKFVTINNRVSTIVDDDLLYTYIVYQISSEDMGVLEKQDFIELDEFSTLKISPYTARLIRLSVKQNRKGDLKRRARRILRKLDIIRKEEAERFEDVKKSNSLNPMELIAFIEGNKQ